MIFDDLLGECSLTQLFPAVFPHQQRGHTKNNNNRWCVCGVRLVVAKIGQKYHTLRCDTALEPQKHERPARGGGGRNPRVAAALVNSQCGGGYGPSLS